MSILNIIYSPEKPQRKSFDHDGRKITERTTPFSLYWWMRETPVDSLKKLYEVLTRYTDTTHKSYEGKYAVMRGLWLPDEKLFEFENGRIAKREEVVAVGGDISSYKDRVIYKAEGHKHYSRLRRKVFLKEVPLDWICFDLDGLEIDGEPFDVNAPEKAVNKAIAQELGPEFADASYILQLSSSAGIKPGIRAHCWFWMFEGWTRAQWRQWYADRSKELGRKVAVDKGMFDIERIHYIAPPKFSQRVEDPVKQRWVLVEGKCPVVILDPPKVVEPERTSAGYFDIPDESDEAKDAFSRPGIVGTFNRCYSMSETIQLFLADQYRIVTPEGRVSWLMEGAAPEGLKIVAGNTKMFSEHNTGPMAKRVGSAFDFIQAALFDDDHGAAAEWARGLDKCIAALESQEALDFDDEIAAADFVKEIDLSVEVTPVSVMTAEKVMGTYPMPAKWRGQDASYRLVNGGWKYGFMQEREEGGKKFFSELWSPISLWSQDVCIKTGSTSICLRMMGDGGEPVDVIVKRGESMSKSILSALWDKNWKAKNKEGELFVDFLRENKALSRRLTVPQRGWLEGKDKSGHFSRIFATPGGEVIGMNRWGDTEISLKTELVVEGAKSGSLDGWKSAVSGLCQIDNVHHWILGVAAGFTGPIVELLGGNTSGIAIGGDTSRGKTTALAWAASVWTSPSERKPGLMKSLKTTANAIENIAAEANGTILLLDETNLMDGRQLENLVYSIASGTGKQRMKLDGSSRSILHWSTFVLLTGESGLAQKFESASGHKMGKGAAVRLLDLDVSGFNEKVPNSVIANLREAVHENHGYAGEAFVKHLIETGYADDISALTEMRKQFSEKLAGTDPSGRAGRAAEILGNLHVAVAVALKAGILPKEFESRFEDALEELWNQIKNGSIFNDNQNTMEAIHFWLASKWDRSVVEIGGGNGTRDIEAWYDNTTIYVTMEKLVEATGSVTRPSEIKKLLLSQDALYTSSRGSRVRADYDYAPGIGPLNHIRLKKGMFHNEQKSEDNDFKEIGPEDLF